MGVGRAGVGEGWWADYMEEMALISSLESLNKSHVRAPSSILKASELWMSDVKNLEWSE